MSAGITAEFRVFKLQSRSQHRRDKHGWTGRFCTITRKLLVGASCWQASVESTIPLQGPYRLGGSRPPQSVRQMTQRRGLVQSHRLWGHQLVARSQRAQGMVGHPRRGGVHACWRGRHALRMFWTAIFGPRLIHLCHGFVGSLSRCTLNHLLQAVKQRTKRASQAFVN